MKSTLTLLAATITLTLAVAASAHAAASQSIVYIQNGNVFIADADGSHPHQVTTDGKVTAGSTLSNPSADQTAYHSPSEADDGTIVAAMGYALYHLSQNGSVIKEIVPSSGTYPLAAAVSPDATKIAYDYVIPTYVGGLGGEPSSDITPADGSAGNYSSQDRTEDGQWIDNNTLVLQTDSNDGVTSTTDVDYEVPGSSAQNWFAPADPLGASRGYSSETFFSDQPVVSRAGNYLALVLRSSFQNGGNPSANDTLQIYQLTGPPPAAPTLLCQLNPIGSAEGTPDSFGFEEPQFSADGSELIWYDSRGEEAYDPAGDANCTGGQTLNLSGSAGAFMPGVSQASFGPAANNPPPRSTTPTPTPIAKPGPGTKKLTVALNAKRSAKRAALLKHGFTVIVSCNTLCSYGVVIGASNSVARALKLTRKKTGEVVLGVKTGTARGAKAKVTVKLGSKARNALKKSTASKVVLILEVQARAATGKTLVHDYKLTITR